jgi:RNA polymerase sigma-70 factor, ECF subfamily
VVSVAPITLGYELRDAQRNSELIALIRRGERKLFHDLVRPYERGLFLAANAVLRNHADAEDAVQDAILKAFLNLQQLTSPEKFKSWLFRIVVNEARLKIRNSHGHLFEPMEKKTGDADFMPRDFADWREDPFESMERTEIREAVNQALNHLPPIYRQIFILRDVEELTVSECAEVLGIKPETVKVRLHRARLMMREKLAPKLKLRWYERIILGKGPKRW